MTAEDREYIESEIESFKQFAGWATARLKGFDDALMLLRNRAGAEFSIGNDDEACAIRTQADRLRKSEKRRELEQEIRNHWKKVDELREQLAEGEADERSGEIGEGDPREERGASVR